MLKEFIYYEETDNQQSINFVLEHMPGSLSLILKNYLNYKLVSKSSFVIIILVATCKNFENFCLLNLQSNWLFA